MLLAQSLDRVTDSMQVCLDEVQRRRAVQEAYNTEHGIVPRTIIKPIRESIESLYEMDYPDIKRDYAQAGELRDNAAYGFVKV